MDQTNGLNFNVEVMGWGICGGSRDQIREHTKPAQEKGELIEKED